MWTQHRQRWYTAPFAIFTLIMLLKIYLVKEVLFSAGSFWLPLITDLPAVLAVFCLIERFATKRKFGAYLIANLVMTCVYFAVIMYYKYFGVVVTYHALQQVGQVTEVQGSVMSLLHPYYLLIFTDIVFIALLLAFSRRFRVWRKSLAGRKPQRIVIGLLTVSLVICAANIWLSRDSINELKKSENMGIIPYQTVEIASGATNAIVNLVQEPEAPTDVTLEAIRELKGIELPAAPQFTGIAQGRNVVIIQLEAFQRFLLHTQVEGVEVTPHLNALLDETIYFPHFYQMVGQGNTADSEYLVNTSMYVPLHGAASQEFGDRELPSLPRLLEASGYQTATFHTNDVKFWNRKAFYRALGFQQYYDKSFFGDDDMVMFGASDEVLYARTADKLAEMSASGQPFYAHVISMSAHHPYNIPDEKVSLALPEAYDGTLVGAYLQAQYYADATLGQFISDLKDSGIWDNSVIMIYGDHMGLPIYSLSQHEMELMKELIGQTYRRSDMLNIPLLLSVPGIEESKLMKQTGGQIDLLPTIANLLGISVEEQIHFGQDLLNQASNLLPERYYLPSGSFVNDKGVFIPGDGFADGNFQPFGMAEAHQDDVSEDEFRRALALLDMSDRYVQSLPKLDE